MSSYDLIDQPSSPGNDEDAVMRDLIRTILEQIWWVIGIAGCFILGAVIYSRVATPVYSADALLQVESRTGAGPSSPALASLLPADDAMHTDAEIEIIKSRAVVEPVVEQFKLNFGTGMKTMPVLGRVTALLATPGKPFGAPFGMNSYAWGGEVFSVDSISVPKSLEGTRLTVRSLGYGRFELLTPSGQWLLTGVAGQQASGNDVTIRVETLVARPGTELYVTRYNQLDAVNQLAMGLQVQEKGRDTGIVQLSLMGVDPAAITAITNAVATSYLKHKTELAQEEASRMLTFLDSEVPRLRDEVHRAETALSEYQSRVGSFQPTQEASVYLSDSLEYQKQVAALRIQRAQLLTRFTEESPEIKTVDAQLTAMSREQAQFESHFKTLPGSERESMSLQRDAKVADEVYVAVLNKIQELSISRAGTVGNVHIVDEALLPSSPVKPQRALIVSAGTVLGIIAGIMFAFCRRTFFTGVTDPEFVERRFSMPIFGSIPFSSEQAGNDRLAAARRTAVLPGTAARFALKHAKHIAHGEQSVVAPAYAALRPLLAKTRPFDMSIESLRGLRASLQFGLVDAPSRVVAFTSPAPSDGKSFVCANLATLLAESGKRVLLIDADLRRGRLAQYFGKSPNGGLTELLTGQVSPVTAAQPTGVEGLHFISTGAYPPNPSEILASAAFGELVRHFAEQFDIIIVDSPPLLAVADAAVIANVAGSTVLVMRAGELTERTIAEALKKLRRAHARLIGGVMNGVSRKSGGRYGTYDYQYAYSYGTATLVEDQVPHATTGKHAD